MSEAFQKYQRAGLQKEKQVAPDPTFLEELTGLINKHSKENASGTPDYILAEFLHGCLRIFDRTIIDRAAWRNEPVDSIFNVTYEKPVPITIFDGHGRGNPIGEAKLTIWPGETMAHGKIVDVIPVFDGIPVEPSVPAQDGDGE